MMTPRHELYAIEVSTPPQALLARILESPYSRIPVYRESLDEILGAVNTKDVATWFAVRGEVPRLRDVLRPIPFVPDMLHAHQLVRSLQQQQRSKAVVVDEFGGVQGIISIEDVVTPLFGNIGDELKPSEHGAERLADGAVRLPALMGLDEAEPWIGTRWEGSAATIGGHIVDRLGRLPAEGERLEIDGVEVIISEMGPTAVRWLSVHPKQHVAESDSDAEVSPTEEQA